MTPSTGSSSGWLSVPYDVVVLAGGAGRRLGGVDKAMLDVGGQALLDRVLTAARYAQRIVCVGPPRAAAAPAGVARAALTREAVTWRREEPAGGGPVAALAAAISALGAELVVVLAVDLPFVDSSTIEVLADAVGDRDGAVALDRSGRAQPLLAAYRRASLDRALGQLADPAGRRMRDLVAPLDLERVAVGPAADDCDTAQDLEAARARAERGPA